MAFTDLHEIEEMFTRLTTAISGEDYAGYTVRESANEHVSRTQQWRRDNPDKYRALLDTQSERRRKARGFQKLSAAEIKRRRNVAARAYASSAKGRALAKARAARYVADPAKREAKLKYSREWKRAKAASQARVPTE